MNKINDILSLAFNRLFVTLILISVFSCGSVAATYIIEAPGNQESHINNTLNEYEDKIEELLGIIYDDTVRVVVAADMVSFSKALGSEFPDWGAAAAIKARKLIVIKSPSHFRVGKSLEELLGHELGHIILDDASGGRWLPRWFEEGFCQIVSGEWRINQDLLITRAVWGSGLIPLTALEGVNRFGGAKASLAYSQSYLAISSLVKEFGTRFFHDFFEYYRDSGNFYESFFKSTGYEYTEWLGIWQSKTVERYRFVLYVFDPQVLFPLIAVLFIILYLIKRYITRRKLRQWQIEERIRGDEQGYSAWD